MDVAARDARHHARDVQLVDDAALYIKKTHKDRNIPAYALTYVYNTPPIRSIKADYQRIKNGEVKEVY